VVPVEVPVKVLGTQTGTMTSTIFVRRKANGVYILIIRQ